ncbi:hypothetical protein [uncultured Butyricimonas sp.]|uniref:hypothetical protein n=1 Tax=uncultured Butyricimonas sp. TaxID=1268785 RepID=UPI0026DD5041|nr:hypothetical protein [uncultured Butyricimonas sp.]
MVSKITNTLIGIICLFLISLCSCTKYNYIDGGVAEGIHDCSMWEYFQRQTVDWDSTMIMIEHAGMKSIFDGSGPHEQITFFGITDIAIARYMLKHNYALDQNKLAGQAVDDEDYWNKVTDIPASTCESILKKMIVPQRLMLKDIPLGSRTKTSDGREYIEDKGTILPALSGQIFAWMDPEDYKEVEDAGAKRLFIARRLNTSSNWRVASTDIQTNTGVVQSMGYDFEIDNF